MSGQAARAVIGQYTFTGQNTTPGQQIVGAVGGLAYGNGTLFVADSSPLGATPEDAASGEAITVNNRVLTFNTTAIPGPYAMPAANSFDPYNCNLCGYPATNVLGEPDFNTTSPNYPVPTGAIYGPPTNKNMRAAAGVATDGHILAVADTGNNRVLIWTSIPTSPDAPANIVLGQADFTTANATSPPTASSLRAPQGVWIQNGKLFVADTVNNRVLIWNSIPASNNQPADLVLGQANFTSANAPSQRTNPTAAANQLYNPTSVTSDGAHLFVADFSFNRVLIWNSIPGSMDQPADVVVGQPLMTTAVANWSSHFCQSTGTDASGNAIYPLLCAGTLSNPSYALAAGGRLFIADQGNDRVLIYNTIPTQNGANADIVLGQPNMTSDVITTQTITVASTAIDNSAGVDTIPSPTSLAYDGTNLYVSDPFNLRVLVFTPGDTPLLDNSVVNWASEIIRQEGVITLTGTVAANDTVQVTITPTGGTTGTYTYTEKSSDTLDTVAQGVVNAINSGSGDPNVTALFAGTGTGSIYLSSKQANLGFDAIAFTAASSNTADVLPLTSGSYLTAGTAATAAPGMLVEIDGTNLAAQSAPVVAPLNGAVPTQLAGVEVFMDGIAAPIYRASNIQVITQIPFSFIDRNSTSIYVRTTFSDGSVKITNATPVYIAPANPGLFATPATPGQSPVLRPAAGAFHQSGNPQAVVDVSGTITAGNTATINVNGRAYTYTVQSSDTLTSIAQALVNAINSPGDPLVTASLGGAFSRVVLTADQPGAAGTGIPISTTGSSGATVTLTAYTSTTCCNVTPGSAITTANPAVPGETINVSATGLGFIYDASNTAFNYSIAGQPYNGPVPNSAINSVFATINGATAQVVSAGLPSGSYSIYDVQLIVPTTQTANSLSQLYIAQNAYVSNIVTLAVGPAGQAASGSGNGNSLFNSGITFTATPNPIPPASNGLGNTTLAWAGAPGNAAVYEGNPASGGTQIATGSNSGTTQVTNVPDATTFYLQDLTNASPQSVAATLATITVHVMSGIVIGIDSPNPRSAAFSGLAHFGGWAVNPFGAISTVTARIDGAAVGAASYGGARPDVCAVHASPANCPNVGWNFYYDTSALGNGTHTLQITAQAASGGQLSQAATFVVDNSAAANPTKIFLDTPNTKTGAVQGLISMGGWAINQNAAISSIAISIDGALLGNATYGIARPDVCNSFPGAPGCPNVGWSIFVDTTVLGNGKHTVQAVATAAGGQVAATSGTFTVANWTTANPMTISIGVPNAQGSPYSGSSVAFAGWALDNNAAILSVGISIDGVSYGNAAYGGARQDVCNAYPNRPGCPNVGWSFVVDTTQLADGKHTLAVTGRDAGGQNSTTTTTFTVSNLNAANPMHMRIDTPAPHQSSPFTGTATFGGWVLADNGTITSVQMLIDGVSYGYAQYGVDRPDVCAAWPGRAGCPNVGWTFNFDTTLLASGAHTLEARATSSSGEHATTSAPFTVSNSQAGNPIRISIDVPNGNSNPFLGLAEFSGWALDQSALIADVSVSIDGVPYGPAKYGISRSDVCNGFPGAQGCPNIGWSIQVDTTQLPDGIHTIGVTATAAGGASSVVSFVFTVANWSTADPTHIGIDSPSMQVSSYFGTVDFGGWALDPNAAITAVQLAVDGFPIGAATYGGSRPDACAAYHNPPGCPNVGWNLVVDTTQFADGTHTLAVTAVTSTGQASTSTATFTLVN